MPWAVNLSDVTALQQAASGRTYHDTDESRLNARMFLMLLHPVLGTNVVECEGGSRVVGIGDGVLLSCDDERGEAIAKIVARKRPQRAVVPRLYYSKTGNGGWTRR
jgi:hypothetical protein